jgi:hypothetical protein
MQIVHNVSSYCKPSCNKDYEVINSSKATTLNFLICVDNCKGTMLIIKENFLVYCGINERIKLWCFVNYDWEVMGHLITHKRPQIELTLLFTCVRTIGMAIDKMVISFYFKFHWHCIQHCPFSITSKSIEQLHKPRVLCSGNCVHVTIV